MDELAEITSKDDLLQGIEKVDREIAQVEQQIINLKKAQVSCRGAWRKVLSDF